MAGEARTERRGPRAARLPATITAWLRREADAARRSAHRALQAPGPERDAAAQALKAALAAFLAWAVTAWWWEAPMALMAPWAAVVLVQSTVYRSLHSAGLQLAVVATGTLLAAGAAALTGSIVAALLIALPPATLIGRYARLGEQAAYAPTTVLFVLAYGSYSAAEIGHRLLETLVGAVIGIAVNALVLPPVHARELRHVLGALPDRAADLLDAMSGTVREGYGPVDAGGWYDRALALRRLVGRLEQARRWADESVRLNPGHRLRRPGPARSGGSVEQDARWSAVAEQGVRITAVLAEAAQDRPGFAPLPAQVRLPLADFLRGTAELARLSSPAAGLSLAEHRVRAARAERLAGGAQRQMFRVLAQQYEAATPAVGELVAATQRLLRALTEGGAPCLPHQHTPGRSTPGPAGPVVRQEDCP
ncbi:aromatic acid exporter family protein [Streptomyces koyangensis]|uniref:FUSC family protein n=1 Tax=Streptomyces koyangensis TaxID=188770 RepID=UPI003453025E